ncbi:MAG TPA: ABC transporter permease [Aggregatilineales bacterium]|nr:ABC transporter permease [Aggregatilineales bacterium]
MSDSSVVLIASQGVAASASYLYAALGEAFGQRAGIYNLGLDGVMLMGAFTAYYAVLSGQSPIVGVAVAALTGAAMGLLMAFVSVTLKAEQGISGIGLYMLGLGLSTMLFNALVKTPLPISGGFRDAPVPGLSSIPILGPILFDQTVMVYGALLLVPISWSVLNRTTLGLNIRAVGQNPQAADAMGVNVTLVRYLAVTFGGLMGGVGGASLSIAQTNIFQQNMTNGIGFIAVALVYFGGWSPVGIMFGTLLFSVVTTLQLWVQTYNIPISPSVVNMLPNIVTILSLAVAAYFYRAQAPSALGKPYYRDES